MRENREVRSSLASGASVWACGGPWGQRFGGNPLMDDGRKSDDRVVPAKPPNKPAAAGAEVVEGRRSAEGNAAGETRPGRSAGQGALSELDRVRRVARRDRDVRFTALLHHVGVERLRAAYRALRPKAAPGVDGVTWDAYGRGLEDNLRDLHARVQRGAYRAKPSRRSYIAKSDGRPRALGIAALEDKLLQRALVEVLNAIYEQDFLGFSHGFRPGRSPHRALDALAAGFSRKRVNWVLDADIRDFFGSLDQSWLLEFLEHRIADPRVLRLIQKWLAAGVIEDGSWTASREGVPQGATVSPLLGNIYLHYVFDLWADQWRRRNARGDVILTRFADDFVVGFEHRDDAERFLSDLRERFAQFGLELAGEKTRLVEFGRFAALDRAKRGQGKPDTFDFLGFTHICAKTRDGRFQLKRVTVKKRMRAKLQAVKAELRRRAHLPIPEQGAWLAAVLRGHLAYYAVPTNSRAIAAFRDQLTQHWQRALRHRSQRTSVTWRRMHRLAQRWLPPARIQHPWPTARFDAITQGRSPVR
jgi:RNA-directed DNA polymerase